MVEAVWKFTLPEFNYEIVSEEAQVSSFIESAGNGNSYAFDVETSGLNYITDQLAGLSIATPDKAWYFHGMFVMSKLFPWLEEKMRDTNVEWIAHNAKFDMHFLNKYGILPRNLYDTEIAQYLVDENGTLALKELAPIYLGVDVKLPQYKDLQHYTKALLGKKRIDQVSIYDIPLEILAPYGAFDARLTFDLAPITKQGLIDEGLYEYYYREEIPFIFTLMHMEETGAHIDKARAQELKDEFSITLQELDEQWLKKAGEINHRSPQQLRELLYKTLKLKTDRKTDTGLESTDALTLQRLAPEDKTGTVSLLLKIRQIEKLISTYLDAFLERAHNDKIYTNFNRAGTVTGRLSSSGDINLQNIPIHSELGAKIRSCFVAGSEDEVLLDVDYSQIELRILAHMCRDSALVRAFQWGADPHQLTADRMGVPRYVGKTLNFGIIYGAGPMTICDQIEKTGKPRPKLAMAKQWLFDYGKLYPAIGKLKQRVYNEAITNGYITTLGGRHRHADVEILSGGSWDNNGMRGREERQMFNSKIQGSAGDIINHAMNVLHYSVLSKYRAKMLLQVHDELLFAIPREAVEEFSQKVQSVMEGVKETFNISVPIIAEPRAARNWVEAKE